MIPQFWFYIIHPRVDALTDLANGKKDDKTAYNNTMELTEPGEKTKKLEYSYIAFITICMIGFSIFTNIFTIHDSKI